MFTRFKALSIAAIFVISVVFLTVFFSNDGIFASKSVKKRIITVQEEVKERESEVEYLRQMAVTERAVSETDGSVIHSFSDDDVFTPSSEEKKVEDEYKGLSGPAITLISLLITLLWSAIILFVLPLIKGRKGEETDGRNNQSYV